MCLAVYLASDAPLPLIPWRDAAPAFHVSDRVPDVARLARHTTKPYVRYAGTHSGCGCGFLYDGVEPDSDEHTQVRSAYADLAAYLHRHAAGQTVEIYTCWGGDEGVAPEHVRAIAAADIAGDGFEILEREIITIRVGDA
jgi:hypothetical protein